MREEEGWGRGGGLSLSNSCLAPRSRRADDSLVHASNDSVLVGLSDFTVFVVEGPNLTLRTNSCSSFGEFL